MDREKKTNGKEMEYIYIYIYIYIYMTDADNVDYQALVANTASETESFYIVWRK